MDEHPGLVYEKASLSTIQKAKLKFPTVSNNPKFCTKKHQFERKPPSNFTLNPCRKFHPFRRFHVFGCRQSRSQRILRKALWPVESRSRMSSLALPDFIRCIYHIVIFHQVSGQINNSPTWKNLKSPEIRDFPSKQLPFRGPGRVRSRPNLTRGIFHI